MVDQIIDDNANFIHLTFAEYFVAEYFVSKMKNVDNMDLKLQDLLLSNVLCNETTYQTVRVFLDGFLKKLSEKGENLQFIVNDNKLLEKLIDLAVSEGNSHIFESLFSNLEVNDKKECVNHHFERLLNQEKKENNIAYFRQTRFIEKEEEETDKNGSDLIPYLKYFVHFGLYYLGAKYGTEDMLTSYLEMRIFNQSKEVLFKAFAIYYDSSFLECVYSLSKSKSRTVNLHVWKFIKELKKDHWSSGNTFNDKENILFAEIEHCYTKGKANNKTVIQYAWINEKCEVNIATNKSDTCNCEKITKFIFAEICQQVMKIQDTFKNTMMSKILQSMLISWPLLLYFILEKTSAGNAATKVNLNIN